MIDKDYGINQKNFSCKIGGAWCFFTDKGEFCKGEVSEMDLFLKECNWQPEPKKGDMVEVKDFNYQTWVKRKFVVKYDDKSYCVSITGSNKLMPWDEMRPVTKPDKLNIWFELSFIGDRKTYIKGIDSDSICKMFDGDTSLYCCSPSGYNGEYYEIDKGCVLGLNSMNHRCIELKEGMKVSKNFFDVIGINDQAYGLLHKIVKNGGEMADKQFTKDDMVECFNSARKPNYKGSYRYTDYDDYIKNKSNIAICLSKTTPAGDCNHQIFTDDETDAREICIPCTYLPEGQDEDLYVKVVKNSCGYYTEKFLLSASLAKGLYLLIR